MTGRAEFHKPRERKSMSAALENVEVPRRNLHVAEAEGEKAKREQKVPRPPTPQYPLKFEITPCVRGVISPLLSNSYTRRFVPG
jgi:hypothetical protein